MISTPPSTSEKVLLDPFLHHGDEESSCSVMLLEPHTQNNNNNNNTPTTMEEPQHHRVVALRDEEEQSMMLSAHVAFNHRSFRVLWLVAECFHVVVWHLIRHCGGALHPSELTACRDVLSLATTNNDDDDDDDGLPWWRGMDEMELLLRLCLRKPYAFMVLQLEAQYGDDFHVVEALASLATRTTTLEYRDDAGLPHNTIFPKTATTTTSLPTTSPPTTSDKRFPLMVRYDGKRVARYLMYVAGMCEARKLGQEYDAHHDDGDELLLPAEVEHELLQLLSAVRAPELRAFATYLLQHYLSNAATGVEAPPADVQPQHTTTTTSSSSSSNTFKPYIIPTRKHEVILYLVERRYRQVGQRTTTTTSSSSGHLAVDAAEIALLVRGWDACVGEVATVNESLKHRICAITEIFHAISSNFGAGGVLATMQQRNSAVGATQTVAAPPTLIFIKPQIQLIIHHTQHTSLHRYHHHMKMLEMKRDDDDDVDEALNELRSSASIYANMLPPWWLTDASPRITAHIQHLRDVDAHAHPLHIFHHPREVDAFRDALHLHQALFDLVDGPATPSRRQIARDAQHMLQLHQRVMQALRGAPMTHTSTSTSSVEAHLRRRGLLVSHLLQYTPRYRWCCCAELLFPLLQSNRCYVEANECLRMLLDVPLYVIGGDDDAPTTTTTTFPIFYRCQKRGEWRHRLAMNCERMKHKTQSYELLRATQHAWSEVGESEGRVRDAMHACLAICLRIDQLHLLHAGDVDDDDDDVRQKMQMEMDELTQVLRDVPPLVQQRCRLLRALWPSPRRRSSASTHSHLAVFHAVMEHLLANFCRRSDRLGIERSLCAQHRKMLRWTPLPASFMRCTSSLTSVDEFVVVGCRDAMDATLWRGTDASQHHVRAATGVEDYVLAHYLHEWNTARKRQRSPSLAAHDDDDDDDVVVGVGVGVGVGATSPPTSSSWKGLHCEGSWIAYAYRLLLHDAYVWGLYQPPSPTTPTPSPTTSAINSDFLWLSPLQEGPADVVVPIIFAQRRRALMEERLHFLATCSKRTFLDYAAHQMTALRARQQQKQQQQQQQQQHTSAEMNAAPSQLKDEDEEEEEHVDLAQTTDRIQDDDDDDDDDDVKHTSSMHALLHEDVVFSQRVEVATFPVLEILAAVPRRALVQLLRMMCVSPLSDGYGIKFSGFPDLIFWRNGDDDDDDHDDHANNFRLAEVKSPSDVLSTKQIAVNDCLKRCGFDVRVVRVVEKKT